MEQLGAVHAASSAAQVIASIAIEGAVDRFLGRPLEQNPYSARFAPDGHASWTEGWRDAGRLFEIRMLQSLRRHVAA